MLSGLERPDSPPSDGSEARGAPSSPSNSWTSAETAQLPPEPAEESPAEQPKPKRCKISREQLAVLIKSFEEEPLPNFDQRQAIAKALGMTPRSVQIWFQNRRQRSKAQAQAPPLSPRTNIMPTRHVSVSADELNDGGLNELLERVE